MTRRAFVLGAGVAGLSAAFGLADRGFEVTLLESRGWLGGRAFAFVDRKSGRRLDNGPHVMLGCYRAMRALARRLGTEHLFQQDRSLAMAYRREGGEVTHLKLPALPVPLAMPIGLLRLRLGFGAKLRALLGMGSVLLGARSEWTIEDWVRRRWQHGDPAELDELCERVAKIDAAVPLVLQPVTPFGPVKESPSAERLLALVARLSRRLSQVRLIPQTHKAMGAP